MVIHHVDRVWPDRSVPSNLRVHRALRGGAFDRHRRSAALLGLPGGSMKRLCALVLVVLATAIACTRGASGPRKLRLAVIPKALDIPVFNYAKIGAERAAAEL